VEGSLGFLFAAVLVTWLGIFLYLWVLGSRVSGLQQDLDRLQHPEGQDDESHQA
jgi:CcmD family protein